MSNLAPRPFGVSWVTGSTFSQSIDVGGGFLYVSLEIPANLNGMTSVASTPIFILQSSDNITFRRYMEFNTATVTNDFSIASSVSNRIATLPYLGGRFLKLEVSGTVTTPASGASGFRIICTDSN